MDLESEVTRVVKLEELGQNAASTVRELCGEGGAVLVNSVGEPEAVVLSATDFRRLRNEVELLRRLALGELECKAGVGHELEQVLAECDLMLEEN